MRDFLDYVLIRTAALLPVGLVGMFGRGEFDWGALALAAALMAGFWAVVYALTALVNSVLAQLRRWRTGSAPSPAQRLLSASSARFAEPPMLALAAPPAMPEAADSRAAD